MANNEYIKILNEWRNNVSCESDYEKKVYATYNFYKLIKSITNFDNSVYDFFLKDLFTSQDTISTTPIIQFVPRFKLLDNYGEFVPKFTIDDFSSSEELLDYVVSLARNFIFYENQNSLYETKYKNFKFIELGNKCRCVSEKICEILDDMNIKNGMIKILPGFDNKCRVENYLRLHCFVYLEFNEEKFLIDCTYGQFFKTANNNLELCGIENTALSFPGIYMLQNSSRLETARTLLERGWIKLTEQNFKNYCDGFALSFLNGLYYERKGIVDYNLEYSCEDYESFFKGYNSMVEKEGESFLGMQVQPLNNGQIDFSTGRVIYEDKNRILVKKM